MKTLKGKTLKVMASEVAEVNKEKGWYEDGRTVGDDIALLHSEISEALEAFRDFGLEDGTKTPEQIRQHHSIGSPHGFCNHGELPGNCKEASSKPEGVGSEMADVLIRLLDFCDRRGIDLDAEYERKIAYNRTRPFRHGGRAL